MSSLVLLLPRKIRHDLLTQFKAEKHLGGLTPKVLPVNASPLFAKDAKCRLVSLAPVFQALGLLFADDLQTSIITACK